MRAHEAEGPIVILAQHIAAQAASQPQGSAPAAVHPETTSLSGPRTDDPHGNGSQRGVRVRIGLLSDGTYGVERWTEDGTRQTPTWS